MTDLSPPGRFPAGILELELTRLPRPAPTARLCRAGPQDLPWCSWPWCRAPALARSPLNLFRRRRARGWWPCTMHEDSGQRLSVGWGHRGDGAGGVAGTDPNRPPGPRRASWSSPWSC